MAISNRTKLSAAVIALVLGGASATAILGQFSSEKEGYTLKAYQDGANTWTICRGHTKGVHRGETATPQQCEAFFRSDIGVAFSDIDALVTVPMDGPERAAVTDFCGFNIGATKCAQSTFLRYLNAGQRVRACDEIMKWVYVGGKDCRMAASNCAGIVVRREQERELCLL